MANTQAVCKSFRLELLTAHHAFGTTAVRGSTDADTFKAALYLASATIDADTAVYSTVGEVTGANYTAGGVTAVNGNPPSNAGGTGAVAFWTPSAAFSWTSVTLPEAFDCVLLYNATSDNRAVAVFTFGPQTVTNGNFTINMPINNLTTGLIRVQ